jgi:DNA-binding beta-propeller fold protein YncE
VSVITVATGDVTDTITVGNGPQSVAFSPNGKKAYVTDLDDGTVSVIAN